MLTLIFITSIVVTLIRNIGIEKDDYDYEDIDWSILPLTIISDTSDILLGAVIYSIWFTHTPVL